jgi:DNA polymerase-3 subunit delta'
VSTHFSKQFSHWPKTGAILALEDGVKSLQESLSFQFASELLCEHSERSTALIEANSHPDFYKLEPLEDNQTIKIDQVRDLIEWVQAKPQISHRKVALIFPAEALNLQAANALLKTLEEVALDTLFILVIKTQSSTLPETIISRCHIIRSRTIPKDPREQHKTQTSQNGQASKDSQATQEIEDPLQQQVIKDLNALKTQQMEPVTLAALWLKQDISRLLFWVLVVLNQHIGLTAQNAENGDLASRREYFTFLDSVYETRRSLQEHDQLNKQLLLEALLIQYSNLC